MKRIFDISFVLAASVVWIPLFAFVAALSAAANGRPLFFFDRRSGLRGRPFTLVKFRTMRPGEGTDKERTTKTGAFMRKFSLDELPQLFQVLSGTMSLVGPRPLPVRYLERYSPVQARRLETLPGITGLAQINGRNAISWEEKFRYDVEYVDSRSLAMDAKIIFLTIFKAAGAEGVDRDASTTMPEFTGRESAA